MAALEVGRTTNKLLWRQQTHQNCNDNTYYVLRPAMNVFLYWNLKRVKTYLRNAPDPAGNSQRFFRPHS